MKRGPNPTREWTGSGPRVGGGFRRDKCHFGHPIETRMIGGKPKRKCWTCFNIGYKRLYREQPAYKLHRQQRARKLMYGLTPEAWDALLAAQNGACGICRTPLLDDVMTVVDHDHETGAVRGILCRTCNLGLGHLKDDPELLRAALAYLSR